MLVLAVGVGVGVGAGAGANAGSRIIAAACTIEAKKKLSVKKAGKVTQEESYCFFLDCNVVRTCLSFIVGLAASGIQRR